MMHILNLVLVFVRKMKSILLLDAFVLTTITVLMEFVSDALIKPFMTHQFNNVSALTD